MLKQCLFLVGGQGTRLRPYTLDTPKPLLKVRGRVFLDYLVEAVSRQGIKRILLLGGYLGGQVEEYCRRASRTGLHVECVIEDRPAGTAGALLHARERLDDVFLLCNGDTLFDVDIADLAALPAGEDWVGRLALRRVEESVRYGVISLEGSRIASFAERGQGRPAFINGGVYVLKRSILDYISALPSSIEKDIFPSVARDGRLYGKVYDSFFIDIGVPEDLARAQHAVPGHMSAG